MEETVLENLTIERDQLKDRHGKLIEAIEKGMLSKISDIQSSLLVQQETIMITLLQILDLRIDDLASQETSKKNEVG